MLLCVSKHTSPFKFRVISWLEMYFIFVIALFSVLSILESNYGIINLIFNYMLTQLSSPLKFKREILGRSIIRNSKLLNIVFLKGYFEITI